MKFSKIQERLYEIMDSFLIDRREKSGSNLTIRNLFKMSAFVLVRINKALTMNEISEVVEILQKRHFDQVLMQKKER